MNAGEALRWVGIQGEGKPECQTRPNWEWPIPSGWADFHKGRWKDSNPKQRGVFLSLYRRDQQYGGAEEGGWYYYDWCLIEYWEFPDMESAKQALKDMTEEVKERSKQGKERWCHQMAAECDKAEAMGVEPDYFGEPNGPSDYIAEIECLLGQHEYSGYQPYC